MAKLAERDQARVELARQYQRVFLESEDGRAVLHDLLKVSCLFTSALDPSAAAVGAVGEGVLINAGKQLVGQHLRRQLYLTETHLLELQRRKEARDA